MNRQRKQYRIGHVAKELNVKRFVIRFWEREFGLSCSRSIGGQRCYEQYEIERFKRIKELLYSQGFTIAGAKKLLEEQEPLTNITASAKTSFVIHQEPNALIPESITQQIALLQKQLIKLRELL
jgi:DNA-binding transcriptional MerR regulator